MKVERTEFAGHFHMGLKEGADSYQEGIQDFSLGKWKEGFSLVKMRKGVGGPGKGAGL